MNRLGRTVGAAVGAVIFVLFFADLAGRLVIPESSSTHTISAR
jgi:hypothetical protein